MHRTNDDLRRLYWTIALTGLISLALLWGASPGEVAAPAARVWATLRGVAFSLLVLLLVGAWVAVRATGRLGRLTVKGFFTLVTLYHLGETAWRQLGYGGLVQPGLLEADYWKVLALTASWSLVYGFRSAMAVGAGLAVATAAIQTGGLLVDDRTAGLAEGWLELLPAFVKLAGSVGLIGLLSHAKEQWMHTDREIQTMRRLAQTDPLTEAWNRRRVSAAYQEAIDQGKLPLTAILFDIDSFKEINDTYGHKAGDQVLVTTVNLVQSMLREDDAFCRWGGEEFLVLCPRTTLAQGIKVAERLRQVISSHVFEGIGTVTASFGVAEYRPGETVEELVARADEGLYAAKERGKNCVVGAPAPAR